MFNNRPIQYVEDELGPRVLTPNRIIHGRDVYLLEELEEADTPNKMEKRSGLLLKLCGKGGRLNMCEHYVKLEVQKNTCLALIIQIIWLKENFFKKEPSYVNIREFKISQRGRGPERLETIHFNYIV